MLRRSGRWLQWLQWLSGGLLIVFGIAVFTGLLSQILSWLPLPGSF